MVLYPLSIRSETCLQIQLRGRLGDLRGAASTSLRGYVHVHVHAEQLKRPSNGLKEMTSEAVTWTNFEFKRQESISSVCYSMPSDKAPGRNIHLRSPPFTTPVPNIELQAVRTEYKNPCVRSGPL